MTNSSSVALLEPMGQTVIPAITKNFVVADKLVVSTNPRSKVQIKYVGDHIEHFFWGKIEQPTEKTIFEYNLLKEESNDVGIISCLGETFEVSVGQIFSLIKNQGNGQLGTLDINMANIFYTRDRFGELWVFVVLWDIDGWDINAQSTVRKYPWAPGIMIFSPVEYNSIQAA